MALDFTSTDQVNFGSGSTLDDIAANDGTIACWLYPDTIGVSAGTWICKDAASFLFNPLVASVQFQIARATQSLNASTAYANMATIAANKYCFVAASWNTAGANGDQHLYHGDRATTVAEASSYSVVQRVGSGAVTSTAALNMLAGGRNGATVPFDGKIAWVGMWNRQLSLGELKDQQFWPHVTSGCVLFTHLGFNGTGTQPDWSGNGNNGTVTGTTVFQHVPVGGYFGGSR